MKYILGFITAFILIVILIIILVGGGNKTETPAAPTPKTLLSYNDSSAVVRLTVDGPVNAQQEHLQDQITVSKENVTYNRISGYTGQVLETRVYDSNSSAYAAFLQSLSHAGFDKVDDNPEHKDERGYCPLGNRYIYELIDGSKSLIRSWSTSCNKPKTYLGNAAITLDLFKYQIPEYRKSGSQFEFNTNF